MSELICSCGMIASDSEDPGLGFYWKPYVDLHHQMLCLRSRWFPLWFPYYFQSLVLESLALSQNTDLSIQTRCAKYPHWTAPMANVS